MTDASIIDAEVVDDHHSTLLVEYRPRMVMTPDEAKEMSQDLDARVRAVLRPDVDYGVIPGTQKPSLLKPGAERLLQWFGLAHHFEKGDLEKDDKAKNLGVTYRCVVTKPVAQRDVTVATCDGYASRDESKWRNAPWNTIVKMAQKRALVGAALQATGASGLFTQDIDDQDNDAVRSEATGFLKSMDDDVREALRAWLASEGLPSKVGDLSARDLVQMVFQAGVAVAAKAAD